MTKNLSTTAFFPLKNPRLVTIPLSFAVGIIVSLLQSDPAANDKFDEVEHRIHTGMGSHNVVSIPALDLEEI